MSWRCSTNRRLTLQGWMYCVECPQYSIRLEALGHLCSFALAVYILHSTQLSATWLNSRSSLAACDWLVSALCAVQSTRARRRRKFGEVSCTECTGQGNDLELISTVKMETKHPYRDHLVIFGNEFPSIYNHCGVMVALSWKTLRTIFAFLEKRPITGKFSKFCSVSYIRTREHRQNGP